MKKVTFIAVVCMTAVNNVFAQPGGHDVLHPVGWGVLFLIGAIIFWGTIYVTPLIIESFVGVRKS